MRAIGYYRIDAVTQSIGKTKSSLDFEEDLTRYCKENSHQKINVFGDLNASGTGCYRQYDAMIKFINDSHSNFLIVIPDSSHIGNDLESVARTFLSLEKIGCKVICQHQQFPDPLQNAFQVLGVTGISKTRSAKIRAAMQERALKGHGLGRPPYGYGHGVDGGFVIIKQEADVVELMFKLYTKEDMGLRLIVQLLNERNIKTRRGGNWNVVSLRDILKNPVYMGTYTRFGLRLPRTHIPIVPPIEFRKTQDITRSRRPTGRVSRPEPFLLSGFVYCGYCDNKMMGVTRRQTWRNKTGKRKRGIYRYYQCQSRNNQSVCNYHTWRASLLEGTILPQLDLMIRAKVDHSTDVQKEVFSKTRDLLKERLKNAERTFIQAMRKTANGLTDLEYLADRVGELDRLKSKIETPNHSLAGKELLANWDQSSFEDQRDFLEAYVTKIVVRDETAWLEY